MNINTTKDLIEELFNTMKEEDAVEAKKFYKDLSILVEAEKIEDTESETKKKHKYTDDEIIKKYENDYSTSIPSLKPYISPFLLKILKPLDVINGVYYNEETDSFEQYPFKVISIDWCTDTIELLGLKALKHDNYYKALDMEFKFIFQYYKSGSRFGDDIIINATIPDMGKLKDIRCNNDNGDAIIALGGVSYWAKDRLTDFQIRHENAGYIQSNGKIFYVNVYDTSIGVVPYVKFIFEEED